MSGVRLFAGCYERFVLGQRLTASDPPTLIQVRRPPSAISRWNEDGVGAMAVERRAMPH